MLDIMAMTTNTPCALRSLIDTFEHRHKTTLKAKLSGVGRLLKSGTNAWYKSRGCGGKRRRSSDKRVRS
jgi:hypothetical protein